MRSARRTRIWHWWFQLFGASHVRSENNNRISTRPMQPLLLPHLTALVIFFSVQGTNFASHAQCSSTLPRQA
jgi:hypothetical protein